MGKNADFKWWAIRISFVSIVMFLLSQAFPETFYGNLALVSAEIYEKPWTIVTHIFMHKDIVHLFSNIIMFSVVGSLLEKEIGSERFLFVFFAGGIISSVADVFFYTSTLGMSGAVYAVVGCLAAIRPKAIVLAFGVPMYVIVASVFWVMLDMAGVFFPDNIAHWAHIFGLVAGIVYGLWIKREFPKEKGKKNDEIISEEELDEWEKKYMERHHILHKSC